MDHLTICLYTLSDQYDNLWACVLFVHEGEGVLIVRYNLYTLLFHQSSSGCLLPSLRVEVACVSDCLIQRVRKATFSWSRASNLILY